MTHPSRLDGDLAKVILAIVDAPIDAPSPGTVLVVEDNAIARVCAVIVVEGAGFSVLVAKDADEALETLAGHPQIGALFTDVKMPGRLDGFQLAAEARRLRPDLGILIASGTTAPRAADLPDRAVFVSKPYAAPTVALALAALLADATLLADAAKHQQGAP